MEDHQLTELFWKRSEFALCALQQQYGRLAVRIAKELLHDPRDVEECVSDALLAVWQRIPPERPDSLQAYFCRIVKNQAMKRLRHQTAKKRDGVLLPLEELAACGKNLTEDAVDAAQDLRADVFDAERFFAALDSTDDETVYIAVNRLAACYNDPVLRERAAEAVEPFMNSPSQMIADSAKRVSAVLREDFDAAGIVRLPDGGAVFTLYPGLDGGDDAVLWRIEDGVLSEWWSFEAPYRYITDLLISPDGKKLAVCLASGKSGFLVVIDFESDKVSGELINTVLADVRARNGMQPHVRADFETYSFAEQVHWTGQGTLAFDAALYFAPEGITEVRRAEYDPGTGCLAVE